MRNSLIMAGMLLSVAISVCAQSRLKRAMFGVRLGVKVVAAKPSDEKVSSELQEGIEARLNSTERYTVTSSAAAADFSLGVNCLVLSDKTGPASGVVCYSEVSYFPYKASAVETTLENAETMFVSSRVSDIVEYLIDHFINGTTDSVLAERKSFLREAIQLFCVDRANDCKNPARKE